VIPPAAILFLLAGIPKIMLMEGDLGVFTGHSETLALVEYYLGQIEPVGASKAGTSKGSRSGPQGRRKSSA
jgi:hypothetical protein